MVERVTASWKHAPKVLHGVAPSKVVTRRRLVLTARLGTYAVGAVALLCTSMAMARV